MGSHRGAPWRQAADLANHQGGIVSRRQLLEEIGMSPAAVDHALVTGRMHPAFRGCFSVGHAHLERNSQLRAAAVVCGAGSVVSHGTAAHLLGFWEHPPPQIDIIAPVEAGRKHSGIRRRHVPLPDSRDRWIYDGVPCTSPSRTIIDCAGGCRGASGERRLRQLIELAAVAGHLNVPEIKALLAKGPRRRGSPLLRLILEEWRDHKPSTRLRSRMEAKMLPLLIRYRLPPAECNVWVTAGSKRYEVDFFWRKRRLVVETDSAKYHDNPEARRRDDDRNLALSAAGYHLLRLRWNDLEHRPAKSMAEIANQLHLHLT
jgi:very-short-patch-repair endonuclease